MKLESFHDAEIKARWKLVRRDSFVDVDGMIISADEETGECCVSIGGENKTFSFGPQGVAIVPRRR